jgi:copper resistance protein B
MPTRLRLFVAAACLLWPSLAVAQDPHAGHQPTNQSPAKPAEIDHSVHMTGADQPREPILPITDADRAAAFPPGLDGHATHDTRITAFVLFDQLEWQGGENGGVSIDNKTWIGGDINRVWLRAEGESSAGRPENAQMHALYGRSISRWWDVVAGLRQDFKPGPAQSWFAIGIQGLAPQWFEVEATAYIGRAGRTHLRLEAEYELLLTNRLILQPLIETEIYGKDDPLRGIASGLTSIDAGLRLRYEIRREFAPYIGLTWHRALFGTADYARAEGEEVGKARVALGVRAWF